ncbi:MAG: ThiF family adenylyltransferase [Candidatus Hodarchaeota archaeon]
MPKKLEIPKPVLDAYDLLLQHRIVEIRQPLRCNSKGPGWIFECAISVPYPNRAKIPHVIPLRVFIHEAFPLAPVDFYPGCEEVTGFPHQDAESGKICLPQEHLAPRNTKRLVHYVNWVKEWLGDAAQGTLLKPGDPYELPDFSRKLLSRRLPTDRPVLFNETSKSLEKWKTKIGEFGVVEFLMSDCIPAIFAVRFRDRNNKIIHESGFSPKVLEKGGNIVGRWLILPDIHFRRHRPPQTYGEITELCLTNDLNFYEVLKQAWETDNRALEIGLILVGFPIPNKFDEQPAEIHWQPLLFDNLRAELKNRKGGKKPRKRGKIWSSLTSKRYFKPSEQLPWGKASNVTHDRMYARGSYSPLLLSTRIALFGCGALGSLIAELLARSGVKVLDLFDFENIEIGNFCRHTLDGTYLGLNKALSLGRRLTTANPLSNISAYPVRIPLISSSQKEAHRAIHSADLIIDCTTSESAFDWLDHYSISEKKRMVSLFFDFHAELLTMFVSGSVSSCGEIFRDILFLSSKGRLPISSEKYFYQPTEEEQIIEGAGCWHPTFPALNGHIQILAAIAVDIINANIESGGKKGLAAIIRRNSIRDQEIHPGALVETVWTKKYP